VAPAAGREQGQGAPGPLLSQVPAWPWIRAGSGGGRRDEWALATRRVGATHDAPVSFAHRGRLAVAAPGGVAAGAGRRRSGIRWRVATILRAGPWGFSPSPSAARAVRVAVPGRERRVRRRPLAQHHAGWAASETAAPSREMLSERRREHDARAGHRGPERRPLRARARSPRVRRGRIVATRSGMPERRRPAPTANTTRSSQRERPRMCK